MVLTGNRYLGLDIWPETPNQAKSIEDIMKIVWAKVTHCWQKVSRIKTCLLSSSGKEVGHISLFISCYMTIRLLNWHKFWIQS